MRTTLLTAAMIGLSIPAASAADPPADPFEVGSIWVGEAKRARFDEPAQWVLTVTERKGEAFQGEILIRPPSGKVGTLRVVGSAPSRETGVVAIRSEQKGFAQVTLRGKLQNGEVALIFLGSTNLGETRGGTAYLRPKR